VRVDFPEDEWVFIIPSFPQVATMGQVATVSAAILVGTTSERAGESDVTWQ